jgi:hypothetical protein
MSTRWHFASPMWLALLIFISAVGAMADPPNRAVDIRYISGEVSVQPGGVNDWVAAVVNRPLTTADRVWTDKDSRAELHLGTAALRMNSETSLTLTNVGDQNVQVELDQGTLNLHIRKLYDGEIYEVDTPNLAFTVTKSGEYRFDVDPNGGTTFVTVWKGEGEATGEGNGVRVRSGERASFTNGTSLEHQITEAPGFDGFDDWSRIRNEREDRSVSARYVSPDVIGYEDLDDYGTWRELPDYGAVWVPTHVEPGWAPYHDGHWAWVEPWGWTWVDDAPWGFAPCHYGRWVYTGGYWGWAPGPVVVGVRRVYAPALVAWVGGSNWGVSLSFGGGGGVGWFPLGYGEPYVPAYHVSREYFQRVNVSNTRITNITVVTNNYYNNTTNVTNIRYANRNAPGAVIAVPRSALERSQAVSRVAVRVPEGEMARAQISASAEVAPSRNSVLGVNAGGHAALPPQQAVSRAVVTRTAPPPRPIPFEARQGALARNPGRPLDAETERQLRSQTPPQNMQAPNRPGNIAPPNANAGAERNAGNANAQGRAVPRPPDRGPNSMQQPPANVQNRSVPRPPGPGVQTPQGNNSREERSISPPPNAERNNAPRPGAEAAQPSAQPTPPRQGQQSQRQQSQRQQSQRQQSQGQQNQGQQNQGQQNTEDLRRQGGSGAGNPPAMNRSVPRPPQEEAKPVYQAPRNQERSAPLQNEARPSNPTPPPQERSAPPTAAPRVQERPTPHPQNESRPNNPTPPPQERSTPPSAAPRMQERPAPPQNEPRPAAPRPQERPAPAPPPSEAPRAQERSAPPPREARPQEHPAPRPEPPPPPKKEDSKDKDKKN